MAFIGNTNTTQAFTPAIDYFNGNGATVAFTLSRPVASVAQVQVVIENVPQNPGSAFTVSGNTLTFTSAPPSGTNNIYVYYTSPITQVLASNPFVTGMIMLWSGSSAAVPSGWLLCDGTNSTPDLRNKFIVGAGSTYSVGNTGGSADAIVVSHTHTSSVTYDDTYVSSIASIAGYSYFNTSQAAPRTGTSGQPYTGGDSGANRSFSITNSQSSQTATSSVGTTGSSGTNANLPPYYALCYIMKS